MGASFECCHRNDTVLLLHALHYLFEVTWHFFSFQTALMSCWIKIQWKRKSIFNTRIEYMHTHTCIRNNWIQESNNLRLNNHSLKWRQLSTTVHRYQGEYIMAYPFPKSYVLLWKMDENVLNSEGRIGRHILIWSGQSDMMMMMMMSGQGDLHRLLFPCLATTPQVSLRGSQTWCSQSSLGSSDQRSWL